LIGSKSLHRSRHQFLHRAVIFLGSCVQAKTLIAFRPFLQDGDGLMNSSRAR
jgi:hypothetical protein